MYWQLSRVRLSKSDGFIAESSIKLNHAGDLQPQRGVLP